MKVIKISKYSEWVFTEVSRLNEQLTLSGRKINRKNLRSFLRDDHTELFAVQEGKALCGMASLLYIWELDGFSATVEDVVVDEAYRGRGLGTKLMNHLIARAKAKKCRYIFLTSRPARIAANKFYPKLGFEKYETNAYRMKFD